MGLAVSRLCADPVYAYGVQAVQDNKRGLVSNAFEEVMLSVVVSSGKVSNFAAPECNGHLATTRYGGGDPSCFSGDRRASGCQNPAI